MFNISHIKGLFAKIIKYNQFVLIVLIITAVPLVVRERMSTQTIESNIYFAKESFTYYKTLLFYTLSLLVLASIILRVRYKKENFNINIFMSLFVLWVFIAALLSNHKETAFYGVELRKQGFITYLCYLGLFIIVSNTIKKNMLKALLGALFATSAFIAVLAVLQFYGFRVTTFLFKIAEDGSTKSTIGNRNFLGSYFVLLSLTAVFYFLRSYSVSKLEKRILYILSCLFFAGTVVSLTRIAWIGFVCGFIFNLLLSLRYFKLMYKRLALLALSFVIIIVLLNATASDQVSQRYEDLKAQASVTTKEDVSRFGSSRVFIYVKSLAITLQNPIFGVGPDCLVYHTKLTEEENRKFFPDTKNALIDKAHSEYLEYAVTLGIPGLLLYICFLFSIFIPFIRKYRSFGPPLIGMFAGWTGYLVQASFNIGVISVLPVFFTFSAILWKAGRGDYTAG